LVKKMVKGTHGAERIAPLRQVSQVAARSFLATPDFAVTRPSTNQALVVFEKRTRSSSLRQRNDARAFKS
jgi:hypothetical protein